MRAVAAPSEVVELIERFEAHREAYRSGHYKEAQLREEFINPFFKALGWDVYNERGYAEAYKDVIHEDAIKVGGVTKAPDYCFRIGRERKFFVEAKKPSVHIKDDTSSAYQLRRYAWSAKLPLSVLTDFEAFAVYDCRQKPSHTDKASIGRTVLLDYKEYPDRWDEIAGIFSRDAVLRGSFDKYAESNKGKRGTAEVDAAFLEEIEAWRASFAQNIARRNPQLRTRELNAAVQATINRIVFLRICEARGIEPYGLLLGLTNGPHVYDRLGGLFRNADERYNSGLFHFRQEKGITEPPDELTLTLAIDDKPLKDILTSLYYPESPYEFSVLPADILGQAYERFLGKVIRLTPKHQAVVEDKPEVKKAGGVFYTPTYIVDYIVKNTVGKLLEEKRPKQVVGLKIADIACGSGSFLIGAYQYLLDWYRDAYIKEGVQKCKKELYQAAGGDYRLTPAERKRILLSHIYGVDIDVQAVEVTKLSLLLKVLEGESGETLATQLQFFRERALPNLGNNIKCGNSLIGPDFYENQQMSFLSEEERYRINVFDWRAEFAEVFGRQNSGFDVVIGNPPYVRIQTMKEWAPLEVEFYKQSYKAASKGNYDLYTVFVERGLSLLNKRGVFGYILPHKFFNAQYGAPLRELVADGQHLNHVVHFGDKQVFAGATTYTCLLFLDKRGSEHCRYFKVDDLTAWRTTGKSAEGAVPASAVGRTAWHFSVGGDAGLFERLGKMPAKLGNVAQIFVGLQTSADKIYVLEELAPPEDGLVRVRDRTGAEWLLERQVLRPFLNHVTVATFDQPAPRHWLIFPYDLASGKATLIPATTMSSSFSRVWTYLKENRVALRGRERGKADDDRWYGYIYRKNLTSFDAPKLITQVIAQEGKYAYDARRLYFTGGGNGPYYGIRWAAADNSHSLHYLQALLTSRLLDFYLHRVSTTFCGGYYSYSKRFLELLPIRTINFSDATDKARHDKMVAIVEQTLALHKQLAAARTNHDKAVLQRQIDALDKGIDASVYELYGLTVEEVRIVEGAPQQAGAASGGAEAEAEPEGEIPALTS